MLLYILYIFIYSIYRFSIYSSIYSIYIHVVQWEQHEWWQDTNQGLFIDFYLYIRHLNILYLNYRPYLSSSYSKISYFKICENGSFCNNISYNISLLLLILTYFLTIIGLFESGRNIGMCLSKIVRFSNSKLW